MAHERNYEAMVIINASLDEEKRNAIISRLKDLLESNGKLDKFNEWGTRKLAYEIDYITEGYYILIEFSSSPEFPQELERIMKITDGILRYLVIKKE